jgi:hypothetical protein
VREGKIQVKINDAKTTKGKRYQITSKVNEVRNIIAESAPRSGFHKKKAEENTSLSKLKAWINLNGKREILIKIGEKFSADDLELLYKL